MKTTINILFVIFFIASCYLFISCDSTTEVATEVSNTNFEASESFYFSIPVDNKTMFTIAGINGTININGEANADSVIINGEKIVKSESIEDAQANLQNLNVVVRDLASGVTVETDQPDETGGRNFEVNYNVTLPNSFLVTAANVNGTVTVDSINNNVTAANVNGQILLGDIVGSATVSLVNGQIVGKITLPLNGSINMGNVNGNVTLEIPTSTSAQFSAGLTNGNIIIDNLTLQNQISTPTSIVGTLGGGQGAISLATVNGNISAVGF
ncbi:MAG: hypothetical protein JSW63_04930 [Ignavibacterium sp.]|nr:MAG: hypothetical protein JSW63_04930 [Ignavibacterium sp.]